MDAIDVTNENFRQRVLVSVDFNSDLVAKYDVRIIPTFLLFKNGQLTERIVGPISKRLLEEKLNALL